MSGSLPRITVTVPREIRHCNFPVGYVSPVTDWLYPLKPPKLSALMADLDET
jgi:hypothetical protein